MSFLITRRPEKKFDGTTKFSRWTAVHNPYIFELSRQDYTAYNTAIRPAYSATLPTVWTNGDPALVPLVIAAGDTIYLNSGMYNGNYTVHAVNGQYITIDTPYIGIGTSGYLNAVEAITNFKSTVKVYDSITNDVVDTMYVSNDSTGLALCDVSGVIRSTIVTDATLNQTDINKPNKDISGGFYIGYFAKYKLQPVGGSPIDVTLTEVVDDNVYYWLSAARQITGDISEGMDGIGQNMKEYVPKRIAFTYANFLTMFERPTYFEGFPFSLSFLYDEDFDDEYLDRHQQDMDVNGTNVGSETEDTLFVTGRNYVNQMMVRTPNTGASQFDVWLETGDDIEDGYYATGYSQLGTFDEFASTS